MMNSEVQTQGVSFVDVLNCLMIEIWMKQEQIDWCNITVRELLHMFDDVMDSKEIILKLRRICILS